MKTLSKQSKKSESIYKGSTFYTTMRNGTFVDRRKRPPPLTFDHFDYKRAPPRDFQVTPLTGNSKKKIPNASYKESTDEVKYGHRKLVTNSSFMSSDSRRTICPYLNTEPVKQIKQRNICNKNSNEFSYISLIDIIPPKKTLNPRCYKSQCFDYNSKPAKEHFEKGVHTPYQKYTSTTQIYHLPGGVKRDKREIIDNTLPVKKNRRSKSFQLKVKNEYNSNVSCLPGSTINPVHYIYRRYSYRKNQCSTERNAERDKEMSKTLSERYISPYSRVKKYPAGCYNTKESNYGKGKKFVNLSQWKKTYYRKLGKLFNHLNPGDGRITCKRPWGTYKNKSQIKFEGI